MANTWTRVWSKWLTVLVAAVNATVQQIGRATLTAQSASIATTAIATVALTAGTYQVSWYARITRAATTSSSLTVHVTSTDGGITVTQSGAAITGNTTGTAASGQFLVTVDAGTTLRYSTTYASAGATTMQYALDVRAERVPA